jgi:hypothetical protein
MIQVFLQVTLRSRLHTEEVVAHLAEEVAIHGTGPTEAGRVPHVARSSRFQRDRRRPTQDGASTSSVARETTSSSSSTGGEPGAR